MSLSANMWTSVSGLLTHGEKMNVIGNNLANVSTVGFKAQRADFADFFYTDYGTMNGQTQVGKGTAIAALIGDFSQGGFESTNSATDLAINGNGFFKVKDTENNSSFYTRAGDFYFDADRRLVNPSDLVLQGWRVNSTNTVQISVDEGIGQTSNSTVKHSGLVTDIILDQWNLAPARTTNVTIANNLVNDDAYDVCKSTTSPLTALFDSWDATQEVPLSDDQYATHSTIETYDEGGKPHTMTVYMDKVNSVYTGSAGEDANETVSVELENLPKGYSVYEYLVTIDPREDMRTTRSADGTEGTRFYDPTTPAEDDDTPRIQKKAGVLMSGLMIFDASGKLVNQSAYTYNGSADAAADTEGDFSSNKNNWVPTQFSNNGLPLFAANFSGKENASFVQYADGGAVTVNDDSNINSAIIELDLGLNTTTTANPWKLGLGNAEEAAATELGSLGDISTDLDTIAFMRDWTRDSNATANNGTAFQVDIQDDGYKAGLLSNYKVTEDGTVYGYYDNGENIPLYQIAMYDFHSTQGLRREGGNLYTPTPESGDPVEGIASSGTFGRITSYYIENSNVDMSREFVQMIACQRGFQANSKSITTTDTMLETVIGMKR